MNILRIKDLLKKQEGISANIFETICAFLNRDGGENGG